MSDRLAQLAEELLGPSGATLAPPDYVRRHPSHLVLFAASVCIGRNRVWRGDLDLTLSEPTLQQLADRAGQPVAVLARYDDRADDETGALLALIPHSAPRHDGARCRRAADGRLRRRIIPPLPERPDPIIPKNWHGSHRPRLLRFWILRHLRHDQRSLGGSIEHNHLLYIGASDRRATPQLILGAFHAHHPQPELGLELTWYPSRRPYRRHPLYTTSPPWRPRSLRPRLYITVWPGFQHSLQLWLPYRRRR